jgi:hypothetical protein
MIKKLVPLVLSLVITLAPLAVASGQGTGLPGAAWWVSFQTQNVSSQTGNLTLNAYPQDNAASQNTYSSAAFSFGPGAGLTYNPGFAPNYSGGGNRIGFCASASVCNSAADDTLPSGFAGAVVASSDVSVVAVASVNNSLNGSVGNSSGHAGGFYAGISAPGSQLLFPVSKHNFGGNTVAYYVQAAGGQASVTITYTMNDGSVHTEGPLNIDANETHLFDPANATPAVASSSCGSAATSPCLGSAVVVANSGSIAGVALEFPESPASGFAAILGASRGFVSADYSTTILAPIFKHDFPATNGNFSGWSLQNTSNVTATVNVTFTVTGGGVAAGTQYFSTITIGPLKQETLSKFRGNIGGMPANVVASGVATSNQPLVAVVNESNSNGAATPFLSTYNAFSPSGASLTVAAPLVKEFFFGGIGAANKNGTSVSVQNAGTVSATINVIYTVVAATGGSPAAGTTYTVTIGVGQGANGTQLLAPGSSYVFNMVSDPSRASRYAGVGSSLPPSTGINFAVRVTSDQPVIALMQEDNKTTGTPNDLQNYEGFPLP